MTKYKRIPAKVFAENASPVGNNPEIGKFGNALQGIYTGEADVQEIQNSEAWSQGWTSAVVSAMNYPPLPEMNGVLKVLSYQIAYLLQSGIAEWNSETTYYEYNAVNYKGKFYYSTINNNTTEPETAGGSANWTLIEAPTATSNSKGLVQPDNSTITVNNQGIISTVTATSSQKGISQPDNSTIQINNNGVISSPQIPVINSTLNTKITMQQATSNNIPVTTNTEEVVKLGETLPARGTYIYPPISGMLRVVSNVTTQTAVARLGIYCSTYYVGTPHSDAVFNTFRYGSGGPLVLTCFYPVLAGQRILIYYENVDTNPIAYEIRPFITS